MRVQLGEQAGWHDPALALTDAESDRIDAELFRRYQSCRRDIAAADAETMDRPTPRCGRNPTACAWAVPLGPSSVSVIRSRRDLVAPA